MTSSGQQKFCVGCQNGVVTCSGCCKSFCWIHMSEHRQVLEKQMDHIVQEHDQLREALNPPITVPHLVARIDEWERASVGQIREAAKQAKAALQTYLDRTKHRIVDSLGNITEQLKSSQTLNVYTEKELDEWMRKLEQLRDIMSKPQNIDIIEDVGSDLCIPMIKLIENANTESTFMVNETPTKSVLSLMQTFSGRPSSTDHQVFEQPLINRSYAVPTQLNQIGNNIRSLQTSVMDANDAYTNCPMCYWEFPKHMTLQGKTIHIEQHFT
ncbi:unnamed protein product [Rotaria magnacalcarata]|uniref:B box-type domain-containing protein n=1 Tax=Rotaria magnacalcarata TaxID=392030 RepID=A0A815N4V3_9BILA|nr:unnamed protein product [Rotaria magnacalcarata]